VASLMTAAAAAVQSGDYDTAVSKATQALAYAASVPDASQEQAQTTWKFERIEAFLKSARSLQRRTVGLQTTLLTPVAPGE
jgi:hypothetical protein